MKPWAFYDFAPLREMLFFIEGLDQNFHFVFLTGW